LGFFASLPPCRVGLEACAGVHYWARELEELGHEVRLIPPQYVKPFVKTNKNDATDAEAICEALVRPTMRFAAVKSADQQSVLMLHRCRELLVRQRTMLINALRGHCGEFGLVAAQGAGKIAVLVEAIENPDDSRLPALARDPLVCLVAQLRATEAWIATLEKDLLAWHPARNIHSPAAQAARRSASRLGSPAHSARVHRLSRSASFANLRSLVSERGQ
jgi:transposase